MDINRLKSATEQAKEEKRNQEALKLEEEKRKNEMKKKREEAAASGLISEVESLCEIAAHNAKNRASIMEVKYEDFQAPNGVRYSDHYDPLHLSGTPKLVWDYLVNEGLRPSVEVEDDGFGEQSWHYITANW